MNKTININLANLFFHIDEVAYSKLQRYLEAIKRSFANTSGSDEIIADIEARIAELFHEKMENERQVITLKEVDEVINIMGQPEDYMVDEDIFEDLPKSTSNPIKIKKLYRDIESKYIGGVSAGLGHYFGIDALWIRLIWILLTIFSWGGFVFIYALLWILVPEAVTTAQKLDMTGETVNISTIEKKVKEGFDDVAEKVKNVDYEQVGNKVKKGSKNFFDALTEIITFLFKIIGKVFGIFLIILGAAGLVGLFIGLFTVGVLEVIHIPGIDFYDMINSTGTPIWLVSLLSFFAIGIPFFFLLYLGLKVLINNLKSIGSLAKYSLVGLWFLSIVTLVVLGVQQATAHAYTGSTTTKEILPYNIALDTLQITMKSSDLYEYQEDYDFDGMRVAYNDKGEKVLFNDEVRFNLKISEDGQAHIKITKDASGHSFNDAKDRASKIAYNYELKGNKLILDRFFITAAANKIRSQDVRVTLYLPKKTVIRLDKSAKNKLGYRTKTDREMDFLNMEDYLWQMGANGSLECVNCPLKKDLDEKENNKILINKEGIDIDIKDNGDSFKMKIDENGVKIKTGN
ncbi:phage shock protein C (PspC) family protein [Arenibacter nanhaiticus]|uniref:Phage shock protein C (PspC) family protein n=1 Tax=Arenibacter nanhaiticus TaxID=558155 RepID=A0A1M6E5H6_9FLAO|nr:PspC domain-containing protein [Arenibacter nanhaiticus]SHI80742.1 phage shock protein C (PspC) family protein [Arenibacter nanhaiticus]